MDNVTYYRMDHEFQGEDIFSFPCCPLCDNGIQSWEPHALIVAGSSKCLAHEDCAQEHEQ